MVEEDAHEVQSAADSIDTGVSTEINSIVESLLTQSSRGSSSIQNEPSSDERRLEQRQKQIDYGKNTIGYRRYSESIARHKRRKGDPETPDKYSKCSKRAWDAQVRSWRRRLHQWDPPSDDATLTAAGASLDHNDGSTADEPPASHHGNADTLKWNGYANDGSEGNGDSDASDGHTFNLGKKPGTYSRRAANLAVAQ
ncbi:histone RNA hairpin-binding protein RNA-binding domain-containing protein [Entophlyctis helioformis]|nr:histone RNA hairpin-binding protein RNA-binding domain-containing protein [Entophlyctis helioformis]